MDYLEECKDELLSVENNITDNDSTIDIEEDNTVTKGGE